MSLAAIVVLVSLLLAAGYVLYGSFIARQYRLDDAAVTPAVRLNDGVDFVPTNPFYLLAQHFSAIAAAGPIAGPILACLAFGWLPCLLWIIIGVILIGAVHDFSALVASVRHGSRSIADVARTHLGRRAFLALTAFIWIALVYVIIAFTQITADTFASRTSEVAGRPVAFNEGGAVAAASTLYLLLAVTLGLVNRFLKPPLWLSTLIFVPATFGCVWAGTRLDTLLDLPASSWYIPILLYCFLASLLPVWLLQQPRGYLGGFVLYIAIGVGLVGVLIADFPILQPAVSDRALSTLNPLSALQLADPTSSLTVTGLVLPFLFVTIACGACSGFHGLICGGTTSKQIARESHCKSVAFGAMLLEGLVAVIALATVMIVASTASAGRSPGDIYGDGLAAFFTAIVSRVAAIPGIPVDQPTLFVFAATFGAMAFSTFVFDTLDVSTRLGRYLLSELAGELRPRSAATGSLADNHHHDHDHAHAHAHPRTRSPLAPASLVGAAITAAVPLAVLLVADASAWRMFWTLFGTSNQLLAALTLLGVYVWLRRQGRRTWYVLFPMLFIFTITLWALGLQIFVGARDLAWGRWSLAPSPATAAPAPGGGAGINPTVINLPVALALLALAALFVVEARRALRGVPGTRRLEPQ